MCEDVILYYGWLSFWYSQVMHFMIMKLFCAKFNWWISLVSGVRRKDCAVPLLFPFLQKSPKVCESALWKKSLCLFQLCVQLLKVPCFIFMVWSYSFISYFIILHIAVMCCNHASILKLQLVYWTAYAFYHPRETHWENRTAISTFPVISKSLSVSWCTYSDVVNILTWISTSNGCC